MVIVRFKKVNPAAILPAYAHTGDAGMDIAACAAMTIAPGARALVPTGLVMELPPNTEAQMRPRSGLALKQGVTLLNTPGTIDAGYRGELGVILINLGEKPFEVKPGMRIAQLVVAPVLGVRIEEVCVTSETDRGAGGFGSTGV